MIPSYHITSDQFDKEVDKMVDATIRTMRIKMAGFDRDFTDFKKKELKAAIFDWLLTLPFQPIKKVG